MAATGGSRVVVITGANQGIGYHLLTSLVQDGYRVAALDLDGDNLRAVEDGSPDQVLFCACDVADPADVDASMTRVVDEWGRVDILVNNAATANFAPFDARSAADTRREFDVNVFGYLHTIRAVLPRMRARDDGIIHNMGSGTGAVGHQGLTGYAATKGAINALTRSLRLELRHTGVSCTLMVPPTTETRMSAPLGYPAWMTAGAGEVGRKLADRIESTRLVITPDWQTRFGLYLIRRFPGLWATLTDRYVPLGDRN